jgi:hypothetical protein
MYTSEHLYSYNGLSLSVEEEHEEDNIKMFFIVTESDSFKCCMPSSPYRTPSRSDFEKWVDCGMPSREDMGGHFPEDLHRYYDTWLDKLLIEDNTDAV